MIRRYTRDLVRAVDALHDKGIVHRDIKGECDVGSVRGERGGGGGGRVREGEGGE